ncbi:Uma2 family endonuclease [Trichormus azollae]|uniref:Uma2 family endonuclease n=1 Tax=Trichormus azollae TaxID=1164 RepID=UPI003083F354
MIKRVDSGKSGYNPDVIVSNWNAIHHEPLLHEVFTITHAETVRLLIEVVSTNWQDDYLIKLAEYERLGIAEIGLLII